MQLNFFLCRKFISKREVWNIVVHYLSLSRSTVEKGWLLRLNALCGRCDAVIASPAFPLDCENLIMKFVDSLAILKILFNKWICHYLFWRVSNPTTTISNLIELVWNTHYGIVHLLHSSAFLVRWKTFAYVRITSQRKCVATSDWFAAVVLLRKCIM